jgi:hypothetical protein
MALNTESGEGLVFGAGFENEVATGIDLPLNTWTHLAGTFDGTTFRFYIDGQLVAAASTLGPTNASPLLIGGSGTCATFEGLLMKSKYTTVPSLLQRVRPFLTLAVRVSVRTGQKSRSRSTSSPAAPPTRSTPRATP